MWLEVLHEGRERCRRSGGVTAEGIEHSVAGRPTKKTTSRLNHGLPSLVRQQRCNRLVVIRNKKYAHFHCHLRRTIAHSTPNAGVERRNVKLIAIRVPRMFVLRPSFQATPSSPTRHCTTWIDEHFLVHVCDLLANPRPPPVANTTRHPNNFGYALHHG